MRLLITLAFLFISSLTYGQGIWNQVNGNSKFWRLKADSVFIEPRDTSSTNGAFYLGAPVGDSGRKAYYQGRFWGKDNTKFRSFAFLDEIPTIDSNKWILNQTAFSQIASSRITGGQQAAFFLARQDSGSASIIITDSVTNTSRWGYVKREAELGANAGGNWFLYRYDDAGANIGAVTMNRRKDGRMFVYHSLSVGGAPDDTLGVLKVRGNIQMVAGDTMAGKVMTGIGNGVATWAEPYDWNKRLSILNSNDTIRAFGDSFTAGVGAYNLGSQDTTKGYINSVAQHLNMKLVNRALSGAGVFQAATRAANELPLNNKYMVTSLAGFNDMRHADSNIPGGVPTFKTYELVRNNTINVIANALLANAVPANDPLVTKYGTWSTFNDSSYTGKAKKLGGLGVLASTSADSLSYTFTNTNVVVQVFISDSINYPLGKLNFYIDGFPYLLNYDGNNRMNGVTDGYNISRIGTTFLLFSNLGAGTHKLVIKKPNAGNTNICIIGHLQNPAQAPPVVIGGVPYMNQAGYTAYGGDDYFMDYGERAVKEAVKYFAGWPVAFAQTKLFYTPADIYTDNVHPNNKGHLKLAEAFLDRVITITDSVDNLQTVTNRGKTTTNNITVNSAANSDWAGSFYNLGTTNAHGLYVNVGASSTGILLRADKNGVPHLTVGNNGETKILSFAANIRTVTAGTTLTADDHTLIVNNTGSVTVFLPAASTCIGRIYTIKKISLSANDVVVSGSGVTLTKQNSAITVQSNGTVYYILNSHVGDAVL